MTTLENFAFIAGLIVFYSAAVLVAAGLPFLAIELAPRVRRMVTGGRRVVTGGRRVVTAMGCAVRETVSR